MKRRVFLLSASIAAVCLLLLPLSGQATTLDLTTANSFGYINNAYFLQINPSATGTGVIQSFVTIGGPKDEVQGYNTSGRPLRFDEGSSPTFTHNLLLTDVPIVNIGGTDYREFLLDINQQGNAPLLSLDQIQIYLSNIASLNPTDPAGLGNLIYNLDAGGDNDLKLNYNLNTGSGSGDMFMYIPASLFGNYDYVYLYSQFGTNFPNNDGFEEWAVREAGTPIPEPVSMLLFGTGLVGIGGYVRRRFKK